MTNPTAAPAVDPTKSELPPNEVTHVEGNDGDVIDEAKAVNFVIDNSHEVSNYANWTFWQTLKHFWKAMAISFACGICAMGDGYQYKMPGNIVALKGFIKQMGDLDEKTGTYKLDPQHVAAWGGEFAPEPIAEQCLDIVN